MTQYCQNCYAAIPGNDHGSMEIDGAGDYSSDSVASSSLMSTHPSTLTPPSHYPEFQDFLDDAKYAMQGAFPVQTRPRNSKVGVLLLRFASDELGVIPELEDLQKVFGDVYGFETEIWDIPDGFAQTKLSHKINEFRDQFCDLEAHPTDPLPLLVVYYGGHAAKPQKRDNTCLWASRAEEPCTKLNWTPIQAALFDAPADVLLLLDCCFASSAASRAGANIVGAKETIAACGPTSPTPGAGPSSFTTALITELKYQAHNKLVEPVLTCVSLHASLLHNHQLKYQPVYARANVTSRNSVALVPFPRPGDETTAGVLPRSNQRLVSVNIRVLLSIHTQKSPTHDLIRFLKDECAIPNNVLGISVDGVRPEAAYESFSTMTLISLPLAAWHLLPSHYACQFVGLVTSRNLLNDESALSKKNVTKAAEQHERLFGLPPAPGKYTHMFPVPPPQPSDSGIGSEKLHESEDDELSDIERRPDSSSGPQEVRQEARKGELDTIHGKAWSDALDSQMADERTLYKTNEKGSTFLVPSRVVSRRAPLSPEQAIQAASMRQIRACLKCHVTRSKCDPNEPCSNCSRRQRTWTLPCTRVRLQDASSVLLPAALTEHLGWAQVSSFMNQNAEFWRGEPFRLLLTLQVGEPLSVVVREVEPLSSVLLRKYGFTAEKLEILTLESPPVLPYYDGTKDQQPFDDIRTTVVTWCKSMSLKTGDTDLDWGCIFFDRNHEQPERQLFDQILNLRRLLPADKPESELLQTFLRLLFFNYVMSTAFVVPEDEVELLYQKLLNTRYHGRQPSEVVCPRGVNKFLKMLLLPVLEELTQNALTGLEGELMSRTKDKPELAISLSFLILVIAGRIADSISQIEFANVRGEEGSLNKDDAKDAIRRLDSTLSDVVIELNAFGLRGWAKIRENDMSLKDSAMNSFVPILDDLRKVLELEVPTKADEPTSNNSRRLLRKWCQKIWPLIRPSEERNPAANS